MPMRFKKRHAALDTNAGKYSHRKIPAWNIRMSDIKQYLDSLTDETDDMELGLGLGLAV